MFFLIRHCRGNTYLIGCLQPDLAVLRVDEAHRCLRPLVAGKADQSHDFELAGSNSPTEQEVLFGGKKPAGAKFSDVPDAK